MMQRALHAIVAATSLAVSAAAPAAEALGVLAVAPEPGPSPAAVETAVRVRARIAEYAPGAVDAVALQERIAGPAPHATVAELERATEAARLAYLAGDYERSLSVLRGVLAELERLPDGDEPFALWTKVLLRLARTELDLGRVEAARAAVERVVRADPDVRVDRRVHPARLVEEVERGRGAVKAAPTGTLVVTSPEAARVYLDGREVGTTPLRLAVTRGRHALSAASGGARVPRRAVDVGEGVREVALDLSAARALRPEQGPGLVLGAGDRARQVVAAGGHLGLDRVVAVGIEEEGGAPYAVGALFDVRRGMLEREGRVRLAQGTLPAGGDRALAEFLVTGNATSHLVEIPAEPRGALAATPPAGIPRAGGARGGPDLPGSGPPSRASLGLRLGWATAQGNLGDSTSMGEWIASSVPVQADLLLRVSPRFSLGAYASYGLGRGGGDVSALCDVPGATCSLRVVRVGVEGVYELAPRAATPWLAAGLGYEWNVLRHEDGASAGGVTYGGIELANLQGGADWRIAPGLAFGPFLMITAGWYGSASTSGDGAGSSAEIADYAFHLWAQAGVRCRLDL